MSVPLSEKICRICGKDCTNVVNVQDRSGRYYCRACFAERINSPIRVPKIQPKPKAVDPADILQDIAKSFIPEPIKNSCPVCKAPLLLHAVVCCECGHNLKTGESKKDHKDAPGEKQEEQRTWNPKEEFIEERLPTYKKNLLGFLTGKKYRRIEPDSDEPIVEDFGRYYQRSTYFCRKCWAEKEIRRRLPARRFHKMFSMFTLGLWLPVWLITEFVYRLRSWRCTNCRGRIRKALID